MSWSNTSRSVSGPCQPGRWLPALFLTWFAMSAPAEAQDAMLNASSAKPNLLDDPFSISLGTFVLNNDMQIELDGSATGTGTQVDWQSEFGGGDVSRFRLEGAWRFAERHKVRAMWFDYSRSKTRTIDEEINWGDVTFPLSASVSSDVSFSILEIAYEYAFLRRENFELAGSFGVHQASFEAKLSSNVNNTQIGDKAEFTAPLPVFGVRALWHAGGDFWIDAIAQYFSLSYEEYDGSILDTRLGVLWQPKRWLGLGVGYNRFKVNFAMDGKRFNGDLEWSYDGPQVFYNASF